MSISQRRALVAAAGLVALAGASGATQQHVFHQASTLKYLITVAGPLFLCVLLTIANPLAVVTGLLVVAAPFAGSYETFHGVHIPLLAPLIFCGVVIVAFSEPPETRPSALLTGALVLALALIVPIVESPNRSGVLSDLGSLIVAAFFASRVSARFSGFLTLAWAFIASAMIQACLAIWESKTGHRLNLYGAAGAQTLTGGSYVFGYINATRPPGAFYDPISLGNMLAIAVPLGVGLVVHHVGRRDWLPVGLALAALALIFVALEITLSRMSWVAAAVGLIVSGLLLPKAPRRVVIPGVALAVVIAALLGVFSGSSATIQRLSSITHPLTETGTGHGDVIRVEIWRRAVSTALAHPVAGVGLGRFQNILGGQFVPAGTQSHAHSTYLQLAAEGGAIALVGLLAVIIALERDLVRVTRRDPVWGAALLGSSVAMLICWLTDVTIRYSGVAVCMGLLFGMVAGRSRGTRSAAGPSLTARRSR